MILWMEVTRDEYELPLAVTDTAKELAELRGTTPNNVISNWSKYKERSRFIKIKIDDDNDSR